MKLKDLINDINFSNALQLEESLPPSDFRSSIRMQFLTKGELTARQAEAFINAVWKDKEALDRRQSWKAEQAAKSEALQAAGVLAPEGRVRFDGVVRSIKRKQTQFGIVDKALIESAEGSKVWLSVPSRVSGIDLFTEAGNQVLVGKQVSVTATFTRSADDATFAFGSRPGVMVVL